MHVHFFPEISMHGASMQLSIESHLKSLARSQKTSHDDICQLCSSVLEDTTVTPPFTTMKCGDKVQHSSPFHLLIRKVLLKYRTSSVLTTISPPTNKEGFPTSIQEGFKKVLASTYTCEVSYFSNCFLTFLSKASQIPRIVVNRLYILIIYS